MRYDYPGRPAGRPDSQPGARFLKINRVIDARMKEDFIRTYEAVDRNFQEIFSILASRGGSANWSLVDPDARGEHRRGRRTPSPAETHLEDDALIPRREVASRRWRLVSRLHRIRSTPFYILDEVEAALDDTNLRRLAAYIDSLRDETQLIMITHHRRTMESG
ncbi:MAG: hypothetical protein ACLTDR_05825 [Adlercreutzia equolifaciens]